MCPQILQMGMAAILFYHDSVTVGDQTSQVLEGHRCQGLAAQVGIPLDIFYAWE
jgi:hypothetical protein